MSTLNPTEKHQHGFMLLFVGVDWHKGLAPAQMQKVADDWMAWFQRLTEQGKAVSGHPLAFEGKSVSGKNASVTDGPFAEAKEAIGGYFLLDVATMDEAVAIARQCPGLPFGAKVEVRPVLARCDLKTEYKTKAQAEAELAGAK